MTAEVPQLLRDLESFYWDSRAFSVTIKTGTPQRVLNANAQRRKLAIQNLDGTNIVELVRDQSNIAGDGLQIGANTLYLDDATQVFKGEVWLVAVAGTPAVRIREEFVVKA